MESCSKCLLPPSLDHCSTEVRNLAFSWLGIHSSAEVKRDIDRHRGWRTKLWELGSRGNFCIQRFQFYHSCTQQFHRESSCLWLECTRTHRHDFQLRSPNAEWTWPSTAWWSWLCSPQYWHRHRHFHTSIGGSSKQNLLACRGQKSSWSAEQRSLSAWCLSSWKFR